MVDDVLVDSKTVMTLSISRICRLSLSEVLIEVGLRVCFHRDEYTCVCGVFVFVLRLAKKNTDKFH